MRSEIHSFVGLVSFILLTSILSLLLFVSPNFSGFVTSSSSVSINVAPTFNHSNFISNVSFDQGEIFSNVFDLDNHFSDENGDSLVYKVFGNSSVIVSIDSDNVVSYSANSGFFGKEVIKYVGDDTHGRNATSNNVTINVLFTGTVGGSSGGGGGGSSDGSSKTVEITAPFFEVDQDILNILLKQGTKSKAFFKIINQGPTTKITIDLSDLKDFILFENPVYSDFIIEINLLSQQGMLIPLTFFGGLNKDPGIYSKNIKIYSDEKEITLPVFIELSSAEAFYESSLDILGKYKVVSPKSKLISEVNIFSTVQNQKNNLNVSFNILDPQGKEVLHKSRIIFVESTYSYTEEFDIGEEFSPGKYLLISEINFDDKVFVSSDTFEVRKNKSNLLLLLILLVATIVFLAIIFRRKEETKRREKKLKIINKTLVTKTKNGSNLDIVDHLINEAITYANLGQRINSLGLYKSVVKRYNKLSGRDKEIIWNKLRKLKDKLESL